MASESHRIADAKKALEHLLGLCRGLAADRALNEAEVLYLSTWLRDNPHIATDWPGNVLAAQVENILADGCATDDELSHLLQAIDEIIGHADGSTGGASTLICDQVLPSNIVFRGQRFLFTGTVPGMSRAKLKAAVEELGGIAAHEGALYFAANGQRMPQVEYLVVGGIASSQWRHSSFGTKIQYAIDARDCGAPLQIITGETFLLALTSERRVRS